MRGVHTASGGGKAGTSGMKAAEESRGLEQMQREREFEEEDDEEDIVDDAVLGNSVSYLFYTRKVCF